MTRLVIILVFLFTACVSKHTVISKGYGNTKDEALSNAKSLAIEKATGVWISTEQRLSGDEFSQNKVQMASGSIIGYRIINESTGAVEIEAVVVRRKDNSVKTSRSFVTSDDREIIKDAAIKQKSKDAAYAEIDSLDKALIFDIDEVVIKPEATSHLVTACGVIKFRQKWIDDFKEIGSPDLKLFSQRQSMYVDVVRDAKTVETIYGPKLDLTLRHKTESGFLYRFDLEEGACFSFKNDDPTKVDEFHFVFTEYSPYHESNPK